MSDMTKMDDWSNREQCESLQDEEDEEKDE